MKLRLSLLFAFVTFLSLSDLDAQRISVNNGPNYWTRSAEVCEGATVKLSVRGGSKNRWSWTGPNGFEAEKTKSIKINNFQENQAGTYIAKYSAWWGSYKVKFKLSFLEEDYISGDMDQSICIGEEVILEIPKGFKKYRWNTGQRSRKIKVSPQQTTTYTVSVTSHWGCTDTHDITVEVIDLNLTAELVQPSEPLGNGGLHLDLSDVPESVFPLKLKGKYNGFKLVLAELTRGKNYIDLVPGYYSKLKIYGDHSCDRSLSNFRIYENKNVGDAIVMPTQTACEGEPQLLTVPQVYSSYLWDDGTTEQSNLVSPQISDVYSVVGTGSGFSDLYYFPVRVINFDVDYEIFAEDCDEEAEIEVSIISNSTQVFPVQLTAKRNGHPEVIHTFKYAFDDFELDPGVYTDVKFVGQKACTIEVPDFVIDDCHKTKSLAPETLVTSKELDDEQLRVYPNPVVDILSYNINIDRNDIKQIWVSDLSGRTLVNHANDGNTQIDVSNLNSGFYFLTIRTHAKEYRQKFIKM